MTSAEEVGLRYLELSYAVRRAVDERMAASGPSLSRVKVLRVLGESGPQRQVALAEALSLAPRSVTQTVEALEREGLVSREVDGQDARAKVVALTALGKKSLRAGTAAGEQVLRDIFGPLGEPGIKQLGRLLERIESAVSS
ncbi:MarR family winged helix-turn-helix transcriptional regulator [Kribbella sp. NPDC056345]|uniref:MarR family winged helix-turn-helix transcriptional regulator n=1 Tax=Kribbella sp. NPDC056345 TaxID=3345789 RepID=UPI0035D89589